MALVCAACMLTGCKKDNVNNGPDIEWKFWVPEEFSEYEMPMAFYFQDGFMSCYAYALTDESAVTLTEETGKSVKKGNLVMYMPIGTFTVVRNEDGISGTINIFGLETGVIEYSGLTGDSVFLVFRDKGGEVTDQCQCYTMEKLGFPVTGVVK